MANYNVTPNMNLPNPVPGVDPGPDYANNIEASFNKIDQHNHSPGQGVPIQPNGLNISSDLPFNGNNATLLNSVRFVSLLTPLANTAPNIGCLYVSGNELFYNDYTGGNQVQITSNGLINATSSGIASGTATANFQAGTLVVKSSSTSFANVNLQSVILANNGNLTNQLTLQAPILSSSYTLSLPYIPAQLSVMTLDNAGNMSTTMNSTSADPVGQAMSATGANAVANTRTRATGSTVGVGGVASSPAISVSTISASYVDAAGLTVTITTSGRPVMLQLTSGPGGASIGGFHNGTSGGANITVNVAILRASSIVASCVVESEGGPTSSGIIQLAVPPSLSAIDVVGAGTYVYKVQYSVPIGTQADLTNVILTAYEL